MKKRWGLWIIFISLILIVNVFAYESTITVKTGLPNHDITLKPADPDTGKAITSLTQTADDAGIVVFNYNLEEMRIKMGFQAWENNKYVNFLNGKPSIFIPNVILDKFVDIDLNKAEPTIEIYSGEEVVENNGEIDVAVEIEEVMEDVAEEIIKGVGGEIIKETTEIEQESSSGITGKAIGDVKDIATSSTTYYILGGLVILVAAILFFRKKMNKKGDIKVTKLSDMKENKEKIDDTEDELADAEKKIKEAKEELDAIRDKKKSLREAQERLEKDKAELKRLEGGEGESS